MDNQTFLKDLKFGMGDGNLNYYLYNFKCPHISENKVSNNFFLFFFEAESSRLSLVGIKCKEKLTL